MSGCVKTWMSGLSSTLDTLPKLANLDMRRLSRLSFLTKIFRRPLVQVVPKGYLTKQKGPSSATFHHATKPTVFLMNLQKVLAKCQATLTLLEWSGFYLESLKRIEGLFAPISI